MADTNTPGNSRTTNEAKEFAQKALFDKITLALSAFEDPTDAANASNLIRNLAFAYRLAAGGAQPGSIEIQK